MQTAKAHTRALEISHHAFSGVTRDPTLWQERPSPFIVFQRLVGARGFEPPHAKRAILLCCRKDLQPSLFFRDWSGREDSNLLTQSAQSYFVAGKTFSLHCFSEIGRGERIRTSDPLVPNQVRYQTALRPELGGEWMSITYAHLWLQAFGLACGLAESTP